MTGKTITIAQQKGGSGKTTLAVSLAVAFLKMGRSVAVIDTDPQGSLGRWFMQRREALEDPGLEFATASAWGVSYEVEKLKNTNDIVIIDTPPKVDSDLRPALREADLCLVPVASSHVDLWATESVLELAERVGIPALVVVNRAKSGTRLADQVAHAIGELEAGRLSAVLSNRVIFAETLGMGLSASEKQRSGPAAKEVEALVTEVADILEG